MAFNVNTFRSELTNGGARPALFEVRISPPLGGVDGGSDLIAKSPFMVRAAQIPAQTLGTILVPYFGRQVKMAGNRTFEPWTVTIINDEDFKIRNAVEAWQEAINSHVGNVREFPTASPSLYKAQATVTQFSKTGQALRTYKFEGFYPSAVSAIDLAWDTDDIENFTVTWEYDYWTVSGATATAGAPS